MGVSVHCWRQTAFVLNHFAPSNWGLTEHELTTIPPSLVRSFMKDGRGGFGSELPEPFGRLLMRGEYNADLYGPLHQLYHEGKKEGTDVWIHKNRLADTRTVGQPTSQRFVG